MGLVTIRVPDELKRKMEALSDLNWSEVVRQAIEARIAFETSRRVAKDRSRMNRAAGNQDEIAARLASRYDGSWDGVEVIRHWREHRYSSSTRR